MRWMFHSTACGPADRVYGGMEPFQSGTMRDTSGRAATAARVAAPEVMRMAFTIQNAWKEAPRALSTARSPRWLAPATWVSRLYTNRPRASQFEIEVAPDRSARCRRRAK